MSKEEISQSIAEVVGIFREYEEVEALLLDCDAEVYDVWETESVEDLMAKAKATRGGGGTDFRPVFDKLNSMMDENPDLRIKLLVYFTDGYGDYPKASFDFDTLWVLTKLSTKKGDSYYPPFGDVIYLNGLS